MENKKEARKKLEVLLEDLKKNPYIYRKMIVKVSKKLESMVA